MLFRSEEFTGLMGCPSEGIWIFWGTVKDYKVYPEGFVSSEIQEPFWTCSNLFHWETKSERGWRGAQKDALYLSCCFASKLSGTAASRSFHSSVKLGVTSVHPQSHQQGPAMSDGPLFPASFVRAGQESWFGLWTHFLSSVMLSWLYVRKANKYQKS